MNEKRLKEAAENAYNAWMGGTMNDVREAMKELGEVLEEKKQHFVILGKTGNGRLIILNCGKVYDDYDTCKVESAKFDCNEVAAFVASINEITLSL